MVSTSDGLIVSSALSQQLSLISTALSKRKGEMLFRRGDACAGVFLIRQGKVRLSLDDTTAFFRPRILGEGSVVGLPAAVANAPYSLTAEVVEDAELACVPQKVLADCLRQNAALCFEVMDILSHEISTTRSVIKNGGARSQGSR